VGISNFQQKLNITEFVMYTHIRLILQGCLKAENRDHIVFYTVREFKMLKS